MPLTYRALFLREDRVSHLSPGVLFSTSILMLFWSAETPAQVYKCTDAEGSNVYSQTPCSNDRAAVARTNSSSTAPLDCSHAGRFAAWTARLMRGGAGSDEVFNHYGGLDSLSKASIGVINYVYSFRSNDNVTVERIAGLAQAKCRAKSFGDASCEALPATFTESRGNCDPEKETDATFYANSDGLPSEPMSTNRPELQTRLTSANNRGTASRSAKDVQQCKKMFRDKIDEIDAQMRRGYSSERGEAYRQELRVLTQELRKCER